MQTSRAAHVLFFLSGASALGYEIVWTRTFAVGLGHELPSMLSVVAAFFGGLALGALALDRFVSRSATPGHWYAALEATVGAWALVTITLLPRLNALVPALARPGASGLRQWTVAFAVPLVALLPATVALGATLPAMERLVARLTRSGARVAGLYAVNTAGAVVGLLVTTHLLAPALGNRGTMLALAAVSFAVAVGSWMGPAAGEDERTAVDRVLADVPGRGRLGLTLALTGLLGIGYEVLGIRAMAQVLENTVFSFAAALCAYLVGTAVGAAWYQRRARKRRYAEPLKSLLPWTAAACLLGVLTLKQCATIYQVVRNALGAGVAGSLVAEIVVASTVFLLPAALMGATFSHLAQAARERGGGVGWALGVNTLGACVAPALFGVVMLPAFELKWSLVAVALGYVAVGPLSGAKLPRIVPTAAVLALVVASPPDLRLTRIPEGAWIVDYRDGVMASVAVLEGNDGQRVLKINGTFEGGTMGVFGERRQAHLPLLLHPSPRRALFLGLGAGVTVGAAMEHPGIEVSAVELVPEVVELQHWFADVNHADRLTADTVVVADARRFVRATQERFDVIVADLFHPVRDGAGALYTREHFEAIRDRLEPGGLFCQWLPLHELDLASLRLVVRTLLDVFPFARAYLSHFNVDTPALALVAREREFRFPADWFSRRVGSGPLRSALAMVGLRDDITLFGGLMAGDDELRRFADGGPLNVDLHPIMTYRAPAFAYRGYGSSHGRLEALLAAWSPSAGDVLTPQASSSTVGERLDRYLAARDRFLEARVLERTGAPLLAAERMLASALTSTEFRPAWLAATDQVLLLRATDPAEADRMLAELWNASAADDEARRFLVQFLGTSMPRAVPRQGR